MKYNNDFNNDRSYNDNYNTYREANDFRRAHYYDINRAHSPAQSGAKTKSRAALILASVALAIAAAVSVATAAFVTMNINSQRTNSTAAVQLQKELPNAAPVAETAAAQPGDGGAAPASSADTPAMAVARRAYPGHALELTGEANIIKVDGERVYMDTKRLAPEKTGTPIHFNANGKTSYGFDWNFNTDNLNFVITCNYNFDKQQYDFIFYGKEAGTAHVKLLYNTADNVQVPVDFTLKVDSNLNVTQG